MKAKVIAWLRETARTLEYDIELLPEAEEHPEHRAANVVHWECDRQIAKIFFFHSFILYQSTVQ
jgi:hypothetical protein